MALGGGRGTVSVELALKSLSGCSCSPQVQREITAEFRSSSAQVGVPVCLESLVQKEAEDLKHISAAAQLGEKKKAKDKSETRFTDRSTKILNWDSGARRGGED